MAWGCPAMLFGAVRITWNAGPRQLTFVSVEAGQPVPLVWPRGFSARLVGVRVELVEPEGTVIGRDGDVLSDLGGGPFDVCSVGATVFGPAR